MIRACLKLERKMLSNECLRRDFCDRRFSCNERFDGMLLLLLHPPLLRISFRCMWFSIVQKRVRCGCIASRVFLLAYAIWNMRPCQSLFMTNSEKTRADLKSIGSRIRQLREGILQEELAAFLGISQGQLSKIERGKLGPSADTLIRLVHRFGKSADWILTGKG